MSSANERKSEEDSQSGCVRVTVSDRRPACTHLSRVEPTAYNVWQK